ncbi:Occludin/ELL family protein [Cyanobium sp. CH-040]|uniref:Occludin/ELL family protein n=1 Tax=Cyanobium sp. CH-040 TaxID=2823708 RepID=UPI0020CE41CE|nr:Occludin/ELL family protein [Cyanobium sp. CH-040]MCP9927395.1 Occludin/ELL family protein [Cyanobium sp. CH-040]
MAAPVLAACLLTTAWAQPATAGPVVCTTTLEAPPASSAGASLAAPVEITRCGSVQTASELMEQRFYSYTAPFARGVSLSNQITDLFGIAMGGVEGNRVMGFGFTDQTIVWDGSAVENTTNFLLDQQSDPMPLRTGDISSGFSGSLSGAAEPVRVQPVSQSAPQSFSMQGGDASWSAPVRGLW